MNPDQIKNRQIMSCPHGVGDNCWWCKQTADMGMNERMDLMEKRFLALLKLLKKVIIPSIINAQGKPSTSGFGANTIINQTTSTTINNSLIQSGNDAAKPTPSNAIAFYFATDTDTIYQNRDGSWIDISFSQPDAAGEKRITDVVAIPGSEQVEITHLD